jgi:transcriptional regulator with XRE-family HTH domain
MNIVLSNKFNIFYVHINEHQGGYMSGNHKRLVNRDKERNQFLKLRYKEGCTLSDMPDISARELATKLEISNGLVSKLESEDIIGREAPPCTASILKLYHDEFECSYEYLMGETEHRTPEYYNMGKDPILKLFDDSFYDKLKELLANDEYQHFNIYMLRAFMNNPMWLQYFMETTFYHLYQINKITGDNTIRKADKDVKSASLWFSLNTRIKDFFENVLMPDMQYGFKQHEEKIKREEKQKSKQQVTDNEQFEQYIKTVDFNQGVSSTGEYEKHMNHLQQENTIKNISLSEKIEDTQE